MSKSSNEILQLHNNVFCTSYRRPKWAVADHFLAGNADYHKLTSICNNMRIFHVFFYKQSDLISHFVVRRSFIPYIIYAILFCRCFIVFIFNIAYVRAMLHKGKRGNYNSIAIEPTGWDYIYLSFYSFIILIKAKLRLSFALLLTYSRCDSVETAELLGGQLKTLASHTDNLARVTASEGRIRSNLGSDGRSTRESESSEGSGELRHDPVQTTTIYESLAAELRAKLGKYYFFSIVAIYSLHWLYKIHYTDIEKQMEYLKNTM